MKKDIKITNTSTPIPDIQATLAERKNQHGKFEEHACIAQALKTVMYSSRNWQSLPYTMKEALEMDVHKTARILAGNPYHHDHWHDKIGYITLIADTLVKE